MKNYIDEIIKHEKRKFAFTLHIILLSHKIHRLLSSYFCILTLIPPIVC